MNALSPALGMPLGMGCSPERQNSAENCLYNLLSSFWSSKIVLSVNSNVCVMRCDMGHSGEAVHTGASGYVLWLKLP